jgi:hypothetical protein
MAKTASGGQGPYDEPGNAESAPANLKSLEETGSKPKKQAIGQKSLAETEESANSLYKSSGAASEPGVHDATVGGGYNKHSNPSGTRAWLFNNRRKLIAGGSVTAILATLAITLFLFVLPLKIMHIVNNLQDRFFATSQSAVDKQVSSLEAHYLKTYVFKGLGGSTCRAGQTIDKNCHPLEVTGNSYVTKLYKTWRANRLEYKMAQDYGLEFKKVGNNIFMKVAGMGGNGVALDETKPLSQLLMGKFSIREFGTALRLEGSRKRNGASGDVSSSVSKPIILMIGRAAKKTRPRPI